MKQHYLLLIFSILLFKANCQSGSPDAAFGNNGVQTTSFFNNVNSLSEEGRVVLANANGSLFVVEHVDYYSTRIIKYLPDGRIDSSYGNAGCSNVIDLEVASAALQGNKIVVAGSANDGNIYSSFAVARVTATGVLDSSFGVNGKVITDLDSLSGSYDYATSMLLQENKILVAGNMESTDNFYFALACYTADGVLDSSFGVNGIATTDFSAASIVLQENKIVVAGSIYDTVTNTDDFVLARYTSEGVLDTSFGKHGTITTDFNNNYDYISSVLLQENKIIAAGVTIDYRVSGGVNTDFALACYTADGVLDSSFGVNGLVTSHFNSAENYATAAVLQGSKIVVGGSTGDYPNGNFALARYTKDGALDSSFGANGLVTTDFNDNADRVNAIVLQGNKIVVAGSAVSKTSDLALARYTADGVLDSSFGKEGLLTSYFPTSEAFFTSIVMQGNKIVAAGYTTNDSLNSDFALARYTIMGVLDSSFGKHGKVTTDVSGYNNKINAMVLQGDKIVVGGSTYNTVTNSDDFVLARYTADGVLDSSFGLNGIITTDFNNAGDNINAIVLQGNKIVAAGYAGGDAGFDFALARYTADGKLDAAFGINGKITTDFKLTNDIDNSDDYARAIALQGNKIIVSGIKHVDANGTDFALARYTADGKLDSSFGVNGKVTNDLVDFSDDYANSITLQGEKIIVAGNVQYNGTNSDFALARYTADGKLDAAFGINGIVLTGYSKFDNADNGIRSITLQGNKILAAGYSGYYDEFDKRDFALTRYTAEGTLDSTFGKNGIVTTNLKDADILQAILVYQNKLYAVGGTGRLNIRNGNIIFEPGDTYGAIAAYELEAPEPAITIANVTVSESKRFAVATVHLSKPTNKVVRVHFTTQDKTAVHNEDYLPVSGPLLFIPGVNTNAKIIIPVIDDNKHEPAEQLEIVLSKAHNASIHDSIAVVTIMDNDDALLSMQQSTSLRMHVSPNPASDAFTVQLQGSNLKQPVSVRIYDVNGTLLEENDNITVGQSLRLCNQYKAGAYIIEAVQGSQRVQTKVIKTGR